MSKYIEADKLWNRLISVSENDWVGFDTIDEVLSGMPAAEVVEVVRCRECEMWSDSFEVKDVGRRCLNFRIVTKPDFYCAWGSKE